MVYVCSNVHFMYARNKISYCITITYSCKVLYFQGLAFFHVEYSWLDKMKELHYMNFLYRDFSFLMMIGLNACNCTL